MNNIITIVNEKNEEIKCEILFTYFSEEYGHHYVVFKAPDGETCGAAIYTEEGEGKGRLDQIENDEEWAMLEEVLNDWAESQDSECSCSGACSCGECDCDGDCNK